MKDEKLKIERDWNDPEHYMSMEAEYDLQKNIGERGKQDKGMVGNKNFMAEGMWKMLEPTLPSNDAQHVSFMLYQKSSYELLNGLRELQQRRIKSVLRHGGDKPHVVFNAQVALMEIGMKDPVKKTWVTQQDVASRKAVAIRKKKSRLEKKK
jgi:hypothetical protein